MSTTSQQVNSPNSSCSPILLSPSSTTVTNLQAHFDNSDQGSVDSDYTSLGSSKFYANSGSNSSLHRQGRSQSIDELTSTPITNTNIPTRHFNGTTQKNKSIIDPLQFVKIQPNHELIERAQEQLNLFESRKRLQQTYRPTKTTTIKKNFDDDNNDWSKAVENWRLKREQKRLKHVQNPPAKENSPRETISSKIEPIVEKTAEPIPSSPIKSKSPSPIRPKGPSKVRQISIEKPLEMRGFGFKLDGGRVNQRATFVSAIEEGSPADKAGLWIDDELICIDDENIEKFNFDQIRKILKEKNLHGKIKLTVRTCEDLIDESNPMNSEKSTLTIPIGKSPVYTFLPYTPPTLNVFGPKPFRSNHIENSNSPEPTIYDKELQDLEAEFEKQLKGIDQNSKTENSTPVGNKTATTSTQVIINIPPSTVSSVVSPTSLNGNVDQKMETNSAARHESPISQVRSYVEKQMDQLQQDLEFGFSRASKIASPLNSTLPDQRSITIPIDFAKPSVPKEEFLRSSLKKSNSSNNELDRLPLNRSFGLKVNPNEQVIHYLEPYTPQRPLSTHLKHSIPDLPSMKSQQKKVTIQLADHRSLSKPVHSSMKKPNEQLWIDEEERKRRPISVHDAQPARCCRQIKSPTATAQTKQTFRYNRNHVLSVSGRLRCSRCEDELGQGSAMVIESLGLYYHIECFRCFVCNIPLTSSFEGTDVRVRNHRLHCPNCFSDDNGVKLSVV